MVPALVSLWFLTGRWFDRRRGLLSRKSKHHGPLRLLYVLTLAAFLFLMLYRCFYFARGGIEGWHGETSLNAAYTYGITSWLTLWLAMALYSWVDSRQGI